MAIKATMGVNNLRQRATAHMYAKRWRTTSSSADVIVVGGPYGKRTTALLLKHIFESQGDTVISHHNTLHGTEDVQRALLEARKKKANIAIVCLTDEVMKTRPFGPVTPALLVVPSCSTTETVRNRLDWTGAQKYVYGLDLGEYPIENPNDSNIAFGESTRTDAVIKSYTLYRKGTEVSLIIDHQIKLDLATYLVGRVNVNNIVAVAASNYVLHRSMEHIADLVADIEHIPGNYETIDTEAPFSVVIDAAPDDFATEQVVESARELAKRRLIIVVEAAEVSEECIDKLVGAVDRLIVVDVNDLKRDKSGVDRVVSPDAAYRKVVQTARQGDTVLLLGDTFVKRDDNGHPIAAASLAYAMESR